ncbi:probable ribosomal protein S11, mitochondrial [Durio zibethinus]|uniref:Probable ribosomal protein S11, mitochondrial n=1 Tax=Durio zibethinus TaxID=66656 RepID=A0A6P5WTM8_DURZI|nr:probable ribosomal protein S11, mitochondrial [Durio zibethinus]
MYTLSSIRQARLFSSAALLQRFCSFNWVSQASASRSGFLGCLKSFSAGAQSSENVGNLEKNLDPHTAKENVSATYASSFRSYIRPSGQTDFGLRGNFKSMDVVREAINGDRRGNYWGSQFPQYNVEQNADFVHIKLMRNNTFVTVTDSKGNKKCGASSGHLGGTKASRYSAEATAEHVGRLARNMGIKSVVVRVKGFTHFKKKRQAIVSFCEGFSNSRLDKNPVVYIEDTTRRPHNGCRLPKKRRV